MSKAVLISIRPKWTRLIVSGKKTIEVRKTRPKMLAPFKCYIYQTLPKSGDWNERDGRVIGEFVCDWCDVYMRKSEDITELSLESLVMPKDLYVYMGEKNYLYGWHISGLVIYDKPKELSEFRSWQPSVEWIDGYPMPTHKIKRAPQSWMYVEKQD